MTYGYRIQETDHTSKIIPWMLCGERMTNKQREKRERKREKRSLMMQNCYGIHNEIHYYNTTKNKKKLGLHTVNFNERCVLEFVEE